MPKGNVLITGIFGQDAAYLAEIALKEGFHVVGGARNVRQTDKAWRLRHLGIEKDIECVEMDMRDTDAMARAMVSCRPSLVYNLAAQSSVSESFTRPFETFDVTMMGALRLFEILRTDFKSTRLFQPSSAEISTPEVDKPNTGLSWRSPYATAKACTTSIAKSYRKHYGLFISNVVLHNHESPLRDEVFVSKKIARSLVRIHLGLQNELQLGNLDSCRDWSHAKDLMSACWQILQVEKAEDFVLSSGNVLSVRKFVETCAEVLGMPIHWQGEGMQEIGRLGNTGKQIISINPTFFRPTDPPPDLRGTEETAAKLNWKANLSFTDVAKELIDFELSQIRK